MVQSRPAGEGAVRDAGSSWGREDALEEDTQPLPCSPLENPWAERPGGLQSMGSQRGRLTERLSAGGHGDGVTHSFKKLGGRDGKAAERKCGNKHLLNEERKRGNATNTYWLRRGSAEKR